MSISTPIDVTNITSDITSDMNSNIAENRPPSSIGVVSSPQPSASATHPHQQANKYDLGSSSIPSRHERNKMHNLIDLESRRGKRGMASCTVQSVSTRGGKKGGEVLLHPMTLLFPESQVTAVMGPKNAGKTTLLNFITGTIDANLDAEGSVNLSGQNGQIAFVPKEDFLHSWRTCRTYMGHYTRLSGMKDNFSNAKLSMDILVRLGMEDHADVSPHCKFLFRLIISITHVSNIWNNSLDHCWRCLSTKWIESRTKEEAFNCFGIPISA